MDPIGIIETLGIPVAVAIGLGYALMYLIKFITKDVTADIKNLYNIVVKLIDSNREAKDEVKKTMTGVNVIKDIIIHGADHFFKDHNNEMIDAVGKYLDTRLDKDGNFISNNE